MHTAMRPLPNTRHHARRSFWQPDSWRVVEVPPGIAGGADHVLALVPAAALAPAPAAHPPHTQPQPRAQPSTGGGPWWQRPAALAALESGEAAVVRCSDAGALRALRRGLMVSRSTMEAVAGLMDAGLDSGGEEVDGDPGARAKVAAKAGQA